MICPYCKSSDTHVKDSRFSKRTNSMRRRRECFKCGSRFTSYEVVEHNINKFKNDLKEEILNKVMSKIDFKSIISNSIVDAFEKYKL